MHVLHVQTHRLPNIYDSCLMRGKDARYISLPVSRSLSLRLYACLSVPLAVSMTFCLCLSVCESYFHLSPVLHVYAFLSRFICPFLSPSISVPLCLYVFISLSLPPPPSFHRLTQKSWFSCSFSVWQHVKLSDFSLGTRP